MGLLTRKREPAPAPEQRAITSLPWYSPTGFGPVTTDKALGVPPFFAAVSMLANDISTLPLDAFRKAGEERIPVTTPQLLRSPSTVTDLQGWLERLVISLALHGNAYGLVTARDGVGHPITIEWLDPSVVSVDESNLIRPIFYVQGRRADQGEIVHLARFVLPGRVVGLSPVEYLAHVIKTGTMAQEYKSAWFETGGVPPGVLKNTDRELEQEQSQTAKQRFVAALKSREPLVLSKSWDYTPVKVAPESGEYATAARMTATQVAVVFNMPASKLGGDAGGPLTYNNLAQDNQQYVTHTLRPWFVLIENTLSALVSNETFVKFNAGALLRSDMQTRYSMYSIALAGGWLNVDEVRALEDLPPLPNGQGQTYRTSSGVPEPVADEGSTDIGEPDDDAP